MTTLFTLHIITQKISTYAIKILFGPRENYIFYHGLVDSLKVTGAAAEYKKVSVILRIDPEIAFNQRSSHYWVDMPDYKFTSDL